MSVDVVLTGRQATEVQVREREAYDAIAGSYSGSTRDSTALLRAELLEAAAVTGGNDVLDVCTGPGWLALDAVRKTVTGRVVGIDDSPGMIDVARKNAPGDHADNLSFEVMDTQHLELDDSSCVNIVCSLGLMHIPDPLAASREMRRVAAPGARLAVLIWGVAEENFLGPSLRRCASLPVTAWPWQLCHAARRARDTGERAGIDGLGRCHDPQADHVARRRGCRPVLDDVHRRGRPVPQPAQRARRSRRRPCAAEFVRLSERFRRPEGIAFPSAQILGTAFARRRSSMGQRLLRS